MDNIKSDFLTASDAATIIGVSKKMVCDYIHTGRLTAEKRWGLWQIPTGQVLALKEARGSGFKRGPKQNEEAHTES